jgi:hypothetical protein
MMIIKIAGGGEYGQIYPGIKGCQPYKGDFSIIWTSYRLATLLKPLFLRYHESSKVYPFTGFT